MANGRIPLLTPKAAAENADIVADMAEAAPRAGFGASTDKGLPPKAKAKSGPTARSSKAGDKLIAESTKLAAAAKTGNLDNLKTAFGATAGTRKACHDALPHPVSARSRKKPADTMSAGFLHGGDVRSRPAASHQAVLVQQSQNAHIAFTISPRLLTTIGRGRQLHIAQALATAPVLSMATLNGSLRVSAKFTT